ncbi:MAG: carbohydrate kinase family protein [Nanoarchaeota archaeon]
MLDVITVGSNTIDWFVWTDSEIIHRMKRHKKEDLMAYPIGAKILIKEFNLATGGGGTNTAATFSKLGLKTAYLGQIGKDEYGSLVLKDLKKYGIPFIGKESGRTGFSIILDSMHDRTVLAYKGTNDHFEYRNIKQSKLRTRWFYFSAMMGKSYETLVQLANFAKKNGIRVAFNPSNYLAMKGKRFLGSLLKNVDAIILNKEEAQALVGNLQKERLIKALHACGPKYVAVTDGHKGVEAGDRRYYYKMPGKKVKVAETLGAGDAFAAAFVTGLIWNKEIKDCLKLGMNNAESCIQIRGAKEGLLSRKEAHKVLEKDHRSCVQRRLSGIFK